MAGEATKLTPNSWVSIGLVATLLGGSWTLSNNINSKFGALDTRAAVLEANSADANKTLEKIATSVESMNDKLNGEREKIGEHEGRIKLLEQWRETVDRRFDGEGGK